MLLLFGEKWAEAFNPKNIVKTVKCGGSNRIMLWECFSVSGTGSLVRVDRIMKKEQYILILNKNIKQSAKNLGLEHQ